MLGFLMRTCSQCGHRRRHMRHGTCRLCRSRSAVSPPGGLDTMARRGHAGFDFRGLLAMVIRGIDD